MAAPGYSYSAELDARNRLSAKPLGQREFLEWISQKDLVFLTQQIATMLAADVPLSEGLLIIAPQIKKEKLRNVVIKVQSDVEQGSTFWEALARHPHVFPPLYVNSVRAGEATGELGEIFDQLASFLQAQLRTRSTVRGILAYPAVVLAALTALNVVLVWMTIPAIQRVYQQLAVKVQLPMPTMVVLTYSGFIRDYWPTIIVAIVLVVMAVRAWIQYPSGRLYWDHLKLRVPVAGTLATMICVSRFAYYLRLSGRSGIDIMTGLEHVRQVMSNAFLEDRIRQMEKLVMSGETLSHAMLMVGGFPPLAAHVVRVGETSGKMDKALDNLVKYADREVEIATRNLTTFLGPLLVIILAGTVIFMALALYLPIFGVMQAIK